MSLLRSTLLLAVLLLAVLCGLSADGRGDEPESAVGPLLKLFTSGRLPAERQGTVVEMICNRGNEHDLRVVFDRVLDPAAFQPELRLQAMRWLTDAATTRKLKPQGDLSGLGALVAGEAAAQQPALQAAAIQLAASWKDTAIAPALRKLVLDEQTSPALRRTALDGMIAIGDRASRDVLEGLVGPETSLAVRMQAAAGLAGFDLPLAAQAATAILRDASPQLDTARLLDAFLDRKGGAEALAAELARHEIATDVAKRALRYMYSVGRSDAELSDILSKWAGISTDTTPPTPEEVAQVVADVIAKGDPARGEEIFRRKDLNCVKCHSVSRAGGQVGPDLSAVGGSSPTDYIVNSILNPSAAVKEQYVTRVFVTTTGKVLTGIVIDRDDVRVNMRDANGQIVTIPTADIDDEFEGKSLMPQGLTKFLTRGELIDLARFISELGKPGPYAVQQAKTIQRWRVLRAPPAELTREVPHLEYFRQYVVGSQPADWDPAYGRVAGELPLHELRADGGPTVVILQGEIEVSVAGRIAVRVDSTETVQTWIDAQPFDDRREIEVELATGRHTITVRAEISERSAPTLRFECQTPENSTANFVVVGGA